VSQEEWIELRESVPYVKLYRYNSKQLYPKLNGYGDNGHRKVWSSCGSMHCTSSVTRYTSCIYPTLIQRMRLVLQSSLLVHYEQRVTCKGLKKRFVFSHVECCDMHFVCVFCNGNARAAVEEYQGVFLTEGFRLHVYLLVFTRHCVTLVVFHVLLCTW
jgi:hypothetical protein